MSYAKTAANLSMGGDEYKLFAWETPQKNAIYPNVPQDNITSDEWWTWFRLCCVLLSLVEVFFTNVLHDSLIRAWKTGQTAR